MAHAEPLPVAVRTAAGKQAVKRLRLAGKIPGTVYANGYEPVSVEVETRAFNKILREHGKTAALVELTGLPKGKTLALYKRLQLHPVSQDAIHIDFQAVRADEKIRVRVPVNLTGKPIGVDKDGGTLVQTLQILMVECLPHAIPDQVVVDVSNLELHQAIHVGELKFAEGITPMTSASTSVATVQVTREFKEPEKPVAAEGAVPAEGAAAPAGDAAKAGAAPAADAKGAAAKPGDAKAPAAGDKAAKPAGGDKKK